MRLLVAPCALLALVATAQDQPRPKWWSARFQKAAPLPTLPSVTLDVYGNGYGAAQQIARAKNLQGRVLWIDGTANLDRVSSAAKIKTLVKKIKDVGFNTIVFDIKPIVGYTLYPSKLTDKMTTWRGQNLPKSFDPLKVMVEEAKANGLPLFVSMNAFSEGHRNAKAALEQGKAEFGTQAGPGYAMPEHQTMLYEPVPVLRAPFSGDTFQVSYLTNVMPKDEEFIYAFSDASKAKNPPPGAVGIVMDGEGTVMAVKTNQNWDIPFLPTGGSVWVGIGKAAAFLSRNCVIGIRYGIESIPKFQRISERPDQQIPLMMNPHDPVVQDRVISFVKEVLQNYAVDGILFDDRLRFGGMNADFSDVTRVQFETLVGEKLKWPEDVFEFVYQPNMDRGVKPGKWYDAWLTFRADTLSKFIARVRETVRKTRPKSQFGIYAGSWFGEYQKYGANYSSPDFNAGFAFLTDDYKKTGFAGQLDMLITGCYYRMGTIVDAMERNLPPGRTVEAAGQLSNRASRDQAWTYAGIMLMDFYSNPRGLERAIQAACGSTQGVMVFDLSHRIEEFWPIFQRAFKQPARAPHAVPGLLAEVRKRRAQLDKLGVKEPPTFIREGAAGAGF